MESGYDLEHSSTANSEQSIHPAHWSELQRCFIDQEAARMEELGISSPAQVHDGVSQEVVPQQPPLAP